MLLPPVTRAVVVLIDGLGAAALKARAGHARTLVGALDSRSTIDSVFPTTTASALATLTTGSAPGQHGLVGYSVLDAEHGRLVNQLSGWDAGLDPLTWQRQRTVFQNAVELGFRAVAVGPARYRDSGFTQAVLRGATYLAAASIADRFEAAERWLREPGQPGLLYLYVPELDVAAHAKGWESPEWTQRLDEVDAAVRLLVRALGPADGLLVTADHGAVDVPAHSQVLIDSAPELVAGIRFVGGEPRCLQLYFDEGLDAENRDALIERWRASEGDRAWIATRSEAIDAGWFGEVAPEVEARIGDLLVAARKNIAYYDTRSSKPSSRAMVGQHGSWSPGEFKIPLLRFGAFAR